jgi:hypothetical protein
LNPLHLLSLCHDDFFNPSSPASSGTSTGSLANERETVKGAVRLRKKLLLAGGTIPFMLAVAFCACWFPWPRQRASADAVRVRYIGPATPQQGWVLDGTTPLLWAGSVLLTNTTAKAIWVEFTAAQSGSGNQWTNYMKPFLSKLSSTMIVPHGAAFTTIEFPRLPPPGCWRFTLSVSEELTGAERVLQGSQWYMRRFSDRLRGRTARFPTNPFATNTMYWGHSRETFSQQFD